MRPYEDAETQHLFIMTFRKHLTLLSLQLPPSAGEKQAIQRQTMSTQGVCAVVVEKHFTQINLPPRMSFLDESPPNANAMDGNRHIFTSSFAKFLNLRHSLKPGESHSLARHRKKEAL